MKTAFSILFWSLAIVISVIGTIIAIVAGALIGLVSTPPALIRRLVK